jgi:hypothetical protein
MEHRVAKENLSLVFLPFFLSFLSFLKRKEEDEKEMVDCARGHKGA